MKKIFLFSTRLRIYLLELPLIALFALALYFNNYSTTLGKLYPLIVVLGGFIIFFAIYFFRGVLISYDEVRTVGFFSSKEKATIKNERTLVVTLLKRRRVRIELYGKNNDGEESYAWLKNEKPSEINLFRAKANGGANTARKILTYFEAENSFDKLICEDGFKAEYELVRVSSKIGEEEMKISIYFKETMDGASEES